MQVDNEIKLLSGQELTGLPPAQMGPAVKRPHRGPVVRY